MLGKDDQQKGTDLREKKKDKLTFFGSRSTVIVPSPRGPDLSFSKWRRVYKSRGSFPAYLASAVQKRSNAPVQAKNWQ